MDALIINFKKGNSCIPRKGKIEAKWKKDNNKAQKWQLGEAGYTESDVEKIGNSNDYIEEPNEESKRDGSLLDKATWLYKMFHMQFIINAGNGVLAGYTTISWRLPVIISFITM